MVYILSHKYIDQFGHCHHAAIDDLVVFRAGHLHKPHHFECEILPLFHLEHGLHV